MTTVQCVIANGTVNMSGSTVTVSSFNSYQLCSMREEELVVVQYSFDKINDLGTSTSCGY
jgi:hypothetical protein